MGQCGVDRQSNTGVARAQYPLLVRPTFEAVVLEEGLVREEAREEAQALLGARPAIALLPRDQGVHSMEEEHGIVCPRVHGAARTFQNGDVKLPIVKHFRVRAL